MEMKSYNFGSLISDKATHTRNLSNILPSSLSLEIYFNSILKVFSNLIELSSFRACATHRSDEVEYNEFYRRVSLNLKRLVFPLTCSLYSFCNTSQ